MKEARVIPVSKAGNPSVPSNYRPISILPAISKVLERIMYDRLLNFLNKHKILSSNQFGFRKNVSTYMATADIVKYITDGFNSKEISIGVFLDLSKAFDTVDHNILLRKLTHYGIRGIVFNWFHSYLSNRKQVVRINNKSSSLSNISCGVPQGSILGPLLFLIYINDLCNCSSLLHFTLFADDTSILYKHKDLITGARVMNSELEIISMWFKINKLSLNISKTNFMIFHPLQRKIGSVDLFIDGNHIALVKNAKFLGINIDSNLTWKHHIDVLCSKISRVIGILFKISSFVPSYIVKSLYDSLIHSHLSYCNIIWGNTFPSYLNRLHVLKKRAVRILTNSDYCAHTKSLFFSQKVLNVFDIYKYQVYVFMFKYEKGLLPGSFDTYFNYNREFHSYDTRSSGSFRINLSSNEVSHRLFNNSGVKLWNSLEHNIKNANTIFSFKNRIKNHLLHNYLL